MRKLYLAGLFALCWLTFGRTLTAEFVNLDDEAYVVQNSKVLQGLSTEGVAYAFSSTENAIWQPLTMLSLMLDAQIYGNNPWGFHGTNILLHALSAALLWWILFRLTRSVGRSGFAAALFALHPLRVESVAWVTERKDVLCGLFFMLALAAYLRYVQKPSHKRNLLVWLMMALGAMAKPILVALPLALLLLDFWPLNRPDPTLRPFANWKKLLVEKWAGFLLAFILGIVAIAVTGLTAASTLEQLSLAERMSNVVISYVRYLGLMLFPFHLSVLYPFPEQGWPIWQSILAALALCIFTWWAFRQRRKKPYLWVGWIWFIIFLFPVVGLVQTGPQAQADRFTYLPSIGLGILGTWWAADWLTRIKSQILRRSVTISISCIILTTCVVLSFRQTACWKNTIVLYQNAIEHGLENHGIYNNLGVAWLERGDEEKAKQYFLRALELKPSSAKAHYNLGHILKIQQKEEEAESELRQAVRLDAKLHQAWFELGLLAQEQGRTQDAIESFEKGILLQSDNAAAHLNLGTALASVGRNQEAFAEFLQSVRLDPNNPDAHDNLAIAYFLQGNYPSAWEQVRLSQKLGGKPHPGFLRELQKRMPEPL